jgi:alpha-D-ribose 1-methylphosphonate 5-triphosphate synthase subunit PhnH
MTRIQTAIEGGFRDPVLQAQAVFRAVMNGMARPATQVPIGELTSPPAPLLPTAGALLCMLADADTPLWLDPHLEHSDRIKTWLAFQTGAPFVADPAEAGFALVGDPATMPALAAFAQGTQEYPDRSTTIVLQIASLAGGHELVFEGPGIERRAAISPMPLPPRFGEQWRANRAGFPCGIDLILAAPGRIACLPRTARISRDEG